MLLFGRYILYRDRRLILPFLKVHKTQIVFFTIRDCDGILSGRNRIVRTSDFPYNSHPLAEEYAHCRRVEHSPVFSLNNLLILFEKGFKVISHTLRNVARTATYEQLLSILRQSIIQYTYTCKFPTTVAKYKPF